MAQKSLTVLLMTRQQRMKTLHLPYSLLHLISLTCISLLVTVSLLVVDYQDARLKSAYYKATNSYLDKAVDVINREVQDDMARLRAVNLGVRRLHNYNESLMKMAGLSANVLDEDEPLGVGGPADLVMDTTNEEGGFDWETKSTRELEAMVFRQEKSFVYLKSFLEQQSEQLSSTPSIKPVRGPVHISSSFGYRISPFSQMGSFHTGTDFAGRRGLPVIATADGEVLYAGWEKGYGQLLIIRHGYGYVTRYGHNDKLLVKTGDRVKRGDRVGFLGSTGFSTGPHCHYEVEYKGKLVNPMNYILNYR